MKFLVDRCAGKRLADWLRSEGHDVLEAHTLGPDPGDREILELAAKQGRVLVTIDTDLEVGRLRGNFCFPVLAALSLSWSLIVLPWRFMEYCSLPVHQ